MLTQVKRWSELVMVLVYFAFLGQDIPKFSLYLYACCSCPHNISCISRSKTTSSTGSPWCWWRLCCEILCSSWGVHRGWAWTSVLTGPSPKGKSLKWQDLNRVLDQQMDRKQTQSQWLGPDTHMSHFIPCWIRGTGRMSNSSTVSD